MKVKDLLSKVRVIDIDVEIKENFITICKATARAFINHADTSPTMPRTVNTFDIKDNTLIIHVKPEEK